jgi:hypothetical protein
VLIQRTKQHSSDEIEPELRIAHELQVKIAVVLPLQRIEQALRLDLELLFRLRRVPPLPPPRRSSN